MNEFQEFLRKAIYRHALSHRECAEMFDVSMPSIQRWVDGQTIPSLAMQNIVRREIAKLDERMKPYLFIRISTNVDPYYREPRLILNQAIDQVNKWTRDGCLLESRDLALAEVDLIRRALSTHQDVDSIIFERLNQLVEYINNGTHPEN